MDQALLSFQVLLDRLERVVAHLENMTGLQNSVPAPVPAKTVPSVKRGRPPKRTQADLPTIENYVLSKYPPGTQTEKIKYNDIKHGLLKDLNVRATTKDIDLAFCASNDYISVNNANVKYLMPLTDKNRANEIKKHWVIRSKLQRERGMIPSDQRISAAPTEFDQIDESVFDVLNDPTNDPLNDPNTDDISLD